MQELFVQRKSDSLVPNSQEDSEILREFQTNKLLRIKVYGVKKPRSVLQLNMFWACCQTVTDNTQDGQWNTKEKVAFQVKVALNFVDLNKTIVDPKGNVHFHYRSISFKQLPHMEACRFFDRAWEIMAAKIGVTVDKLLENSNP